MALKNNHIYLLLAFIFLPFDLANAQNESNSNPDDRFIEAIFDLMSISLIIFMVDAVNISESIKGIQLEMLKFFFQLLIYSLSIFFTVRFYKHTGDFFYIQYLITNLVTTTTNTFVDIFTDCRSTDSHFSRLSYLSSSLYFIRFIVHLTFLLIAIIRNYVDNLHYLFILVPSLSVTVYQIMGIIHQIIIEILIEDKSESLEDLEEINSDDIDSDEAESGG
ncbi:2333_t:CDS:2 [Dentiscutata heterogama]|uniref:2333_t:CDS:1 n=1 Tax=Dentiscutata heterogama TaxID=1316150 RepID=A0ACA9MGI0_9GLOM|nr:2333_t:CDS:2 [Dentiscutata heterogama]